MEILVFWIMSIIISYILQMAHSIRVFKDVADEGYKIDFKRISEIGKSLNPETVKFEKLLMLILGVNFGLVLKRAKEYSDSKHLICDQFRIMGCVKPMTQEELDAYNNKKSSLKALAISLRSRFSNLNIKTIAILESGGKINMISYSEEEPGEREIIKVKGPASKLSTQGQLALIKLHLELNKEVDKLFSEIGFSILPNDDFEIDEDFATSSPEANCPNLSSSKTISGNLMSDKDVAFLAEQKETLEKLREEVLAMVRKELDGKNSSKGRK